MYFLKYMHVHFHFFLDDLEFQKKSTNEKISKFLYLNVVHFIFPQLKTFSITYNVIYRRLLLFFVILPCCRNFGFDFALKQKHHPVSIYVTWAASSGQHKGKATILNFSICLQNHWIWRSFFNILVHTHTYTHNKN